MLYNLKKIYKNKPTKVHFILKTKKIIFSNFYLSDHREEIEKLAILDTLLI